MKKWIASTAAVMGLAGVISQTPQAFAAGTVIVEKPQQMEVLVNGRKVQFPDVRPKVVNNSVLIPLRFVSEKLGAKLALKDAEITLAKADKTIKLQIGSKTATVNGKSVTLNAAATAESGRTMVPLRFISEAFGEAVQMDDATQFVWIGKKDIPKIEDVIKPVDLAPYEKKYFSNTNRDILLTHFVDGREQRATQALVITEKDFPLHIAGRNYYSFDLVKNSLSDEYIRSVSTDRSQLGVPFFYMVNNVPARIRSNNPNYVKNQGDLRTRYYKIISNSDPDLGIKNWQTFKGKDIDYLYLALGFPYAVFYKTNWSE